MLATCDILLRHTLQAGIEWYLDVKLQQAFKPQRLAELLNLLRGKYFHYLGFYINFMTV